MTDTHAHLDACDVPPAELLDRARAAGVTRVVTIGTGIESCRRALEIAETEPGVVAALGIDPHRAATPDAGRVDELRDLLAHPRAVAVGETGLDGHHGSETLREQRVLLDAQLALADELGLPVVIHSRAASAETASALEPFTGTVILHCFSEPALLEPALERGYYVSFAGNVTYPKAVELREVAAVVPSDRLLAETDSPYLAPQPVRGRPNEPMHVRHTVAAIAEARGVRRRGARGTAGRECRDGVRARSHVSRVTPKKAFGQHFLVDRNVLRVIERLAALDADDVVLEVGPGLGVLTTFLADRVRYVHAVEIDRALEQPLRDVLAGRENVALVIADALAVDVAGLEPSPRKLVANLPYNVATPLVAETLTGVAVPHVVVRHGAARGRRPVLRRAGHEGVRRGVRPRATPRATHRLPPGLADGVPARRRTSTRRSSPSSGSRPPPDADRVLAVVSAAFAHRRKTLANALALAGVAGRERAVGALAAIGRPADVRAEALQPEEFVRLTEALAA